MYRNGYEKHFAFIVALPSIVNTMMPNLEIDDRPSQIKVTAFDTVHVAIEICE